MRVVRPLPGASRQTCALFVAGASARASGARLPADAAAALVRTGVVALYSEFAAIKAAQPVVDRLGTQLMRLQAAAYERYAAEEAAPTGDGTAEVVAAADGLYAALAEFRDAVIDLAAAVDEVDDGADLRLAVSASADGAAALGCALEAAEAAATAAGAPAAEPAAAVAGVRVHLARAALALDALALVARA